MQKIPPSSGTDQEISGLQYDPAIQKLFKDAIEVLRLSGADENATGKYAHYYCFWAELKILVLVTVIVFAVAVIYFILFFLGGGVAREGIGSAVLFPNSFDVGILHLFCNMYNRQEA